MIIQVHVKIHVMKIAQILSYLSFLRKWYSGFVIILSNIVPSLLVFELDGTPALCYAECMMVCWDGQLPHQLLRKCHFSLQRLWTKINQEQFQADVGLSGNLRYLKMILLKRSSDFGQDSWKSFFPKNMTLFIASYLKHHRRRSKRECQAESEEKAPVMRRQSCKET